MSGDYKLELLAKLNECIAGMFGVESAVRYEFTETGLFADYALPVTLNPENFERLRSEMPSGISCVYELTGFSGVYSGEGSGGEVLQRVYAAAFDSEEAFAAHKEFIQKAEERDHKKIGSQMNLYSSLEEIGAGLALWHPRGAMIRFMLEQFGQSAHILNGYQWVYTPHIGRANLWETSGHLDFYRDSMYSPIDIDGEQYYLKPMNCPFHIHIYKNTNHSYRDLPVRLAEYGTVYRYELSGTLNGLTRVRGFTQDDAHIICTPGQIEVETANALKFSLYVLRAFGFEDFQIYVSTKPSVKCIGSDEDWAAATEVLKKAVASANMSYKIDEGGGAFYGPKIDIKLNDVLNREWQCSTIQFDFNLPQRFQMRYTAADGKSHTPYMIHRALFGSIERFVALLTEHYGGDFPLWFTPTQFAIVPINPAHNDYCKGLELEFKKRGFRITADYADLHMREKIKRFELEKIPYIFIVGDRDIQGKVFSVRSRKDGSLGAMNSQQFLRHVEVDLAQGTARYILED